MKEQHFTRRDFIGKTAAGLTGLADGLVMAADRTNGFNLHCDIKYVYLYNLALTAGQVNRLTADPQCWLRRRPLIVSEAAGLSIPVFMHHYKQAAGAA